MTSMPSQSSVQLGNCPLRAIQLRQILEDACRGDVHSLILTDAEGNIQMQVDRPARLGQIDEIGSSESTASVQVLPGMSPVAIVQAVGPTSTDAELSAAIAASRLSEAWAAAEEIESLAGELVRSYEELHLLYDLGESLTGQLNATEAAALILSKIFNTISGSWAELILTSSYGRTELRCGDPVLPLDEQTDNEMELSTTLRSNGQVVGTIVIVRAADTKPFSSYDGKLLDAVGTLAVNAIRSAQMYEELRRRAEALRISEAHLRAVLDNVADAIITMDELGIVDSFNVAAERIFNYSPTEVIGGGFGALMPESNYQEYISTLSDYLTADSDKIVSPTLRQTLGRRKDGTTFPMEVCLGEMRMDGRRLFIASVRDITAHKQAEETLQRTERLRALGQLAGGVAHDLNQSLGLISGYSDLAVQALGSPNPDLDGLRKTLDLVAQAAIDGSETVKRLLLFARNQPKSDREQINLKRLLEDVVQLTAPRWRDATQMEGYPVTLELTGDNEVFVSGWPASLKEAVTNLVFNAVDALPHGGRIQLVVRMEHDRAHIMVTDNGIGMSPEVQTRIFEPFFSTKGARGTGLGLAMVFGVVEKHGGTVTVESTPGLGTTFHLTFPAVAAHSTQNVTKAPVQAKPHHLRVLAVDDERAMGRMVVGILQIDGHTVATATSGEEALQWLEREPFDLVISDLGMGAGMNGWDLASEVRRRWPHIRFVLSTGWGARIDPFEARAKGVEAVVSKPFRLAQLRQLVAGSPESR